jgi:hypothetical protein
LDFKLFLSILINLFFLYFKTKIKIKIPPQHNEIIIPIVKKESLFTISISEEEGVSNIGLINTVSLITNLSMFSGIFGDGDGIKSEVIFLCPYLLLGDGDNV